MKNQFFFRAAAVLLCGLLLFTAAGCSSSSANDMGASPSADYYPAEENLSATSGEYDSAEMGDSAEMDDAGKSDVMAYAENRKIIKTARYSLETKDYDATLSSLQQRLDEIGGYVQQSESFGDSTQGSAQISLILRIPADDYDSFRDFVPELGNVTSGNEGGEDVTEQYFDTETRLTVLRAQETRLLELLNQADTVEEMLQIEDHLSSIRIEIEQLTTVIKRLDSLTSMATVTLEIIQAREYTPPQPDKTFGAQLLQAVQDSWDDFLGFCQDILFLLIRMLPFLLLLAVMCIVIFLLIKRNLKKHQKPLPPQNNEPLPPEPPKA